MRLQPPAFPDPLKPYNDLLTVIYECIDAEEDIESFEFSDTSLEAFHQSKLEFHHCQFKNCQFLSSGLTLSLIHILEFLKLTSALKL